MNIKGNLPIKSSRRPQASLGASSLCLGVLACSLLTQSLGCVAEEAQVELSESDALAPIATVETGAGITVHFYDEDPSEAGTIISIVELGAGPGDLTPVQVMGQVGATPLELFLSLSEDEAPEELWLAHERIRGSDEVLPRPQLEAYVDEGFRAGAEAQNLGISFNDDFCSQDFPANFLAWAQGVDFSFSGLIDGPSHYAYVNDASEIWAGVCNDHELEEPIGGAIGLSMAVSNTGVFWANISTPETFLGRQGFHLGFIDTGGGSPKRAAGMHYWRDTNTNIRVRVKWSAELPSPYVAYVKSDSTEDPDEDGPLCDGEPDPSNWTTHCSYYCNSVWEYCPNDNDFENPPPGKSGYDYCMDYCSCEWSAGSYSAADEDTAYCRMYSFAHGEGCNGLRIDSPDCTLP